MARYRKKPVVIDAWRISELIDRASWPWASLPDRVRQAYDDGALHFGDTFIYVDTLEGEKLRGDENDWLIQGVVGELYPCRNDIFEATYEAAE